MAGLPHNEGGHPLNGSGNSTPHLIPASDYATAYSSVWSHPDNGLFSTADLDLLRNVNCSYLSTGRGPTLLALKQHAQSLCILIKKLSMNGQMEVADRYLRFDKDDAFDWLNDLDTPYDNNDEAHHVPLWSLENNVRSSKDEGPESKCPLTEKHDAAGRVHHPHMDHANLVEHADSCLSILDHEFSATGGLLSMLPPGPTDVENMRSLQNSFLGQWLLHYQALIGRTHELEINYAQVLDVIEGESFLPPNITLDDQGMNTTGQAYPQHHFVLVNAGMKIFHELHNRFDQQEARFMQQQHLWKDRGVSGKGMWSCNADEAFHRGLVQIDVTSRFFRYAGVGKTAPIFILPAWDIHPAVAQTREIEKQPTVVSVRDKDFPERYSVIEEKARLAEKSVRRSNLETAIHRQKLADVRKMITEAEELFQAEISELDERQANDVGALKSLVNMLRSQNQEMYGVLTGLAEMAVSPAGYFSSQK